MEILVTREVVVDAATIEEALETTKPAKGITISLGARPRPAASQPPQPQVRTLGPPPTQK